jgi:uncharacterized ion transporter superfamily protein YfcC
MYFVRLGPWSVFVCVLIIVLISYCHMIKHQQKTCSNIVKNMFKNRQKTHGQDAQRVYEGKPKPAGNPVVVVVVVVVVIVFVIVIVVHVENGTGIPRHGRAPVRASPAGAGAHL